MQDQVDPDSTYGLGAELAVRNVDGCDAASLTIVRKRKQVETRGATSEAARHADHLQHDCGEGPCLDAVWDELVVESPSLAYDRRWPAWGPKVVEETGFHSVMSFRLFSHADVLGAMNLYSATRDGFDDEDRIDGIAIAAHLAVAVTGSQTEADLETALASRTVIGQATGILIERYQLTADVAFKLLVRTSSEEEVKVRDLAAEVVQSGRLRGTGTD